MTQNHLREIIEQLKELQDQADEWMVNETGLQREFHRGQVDGFRQAILVVQAAGSAGDQKAPQCECDAPTKKLFRGTYVCPKCWEELRLDTFE